MEKTTLYSKDVSGNIRLWSIRHDEDTIYMSSGLLGGEENESTEPVQFGLANRTRLEQIESRIKSRVNKKLDSGYVYDLDDARNNIRTNSLGYLKSQKCSRWDQEHKKFPYTISYIQRKYDGHHCSITNDNGVKVAYSRNGKIINSIDHILDGIDIPIGVTVEGELYHHGTLVQTIGSWVKKKQENSFNLTFICYDIMSSESYCDRYEALRQLDLGKHAMLAPTDTVYGYFDIMPIMKQFVKEGYEGAIVRMDGFPFESDKRSKGAIKVKPMHFDDEFAIDDEFLVVSIGQSRDGWAVLNCETSKGVPFKVSCFGTMEYKKYVWENRDKFVLKHIRVQFSGWTKDKKPFHPVALNWREKADE